MKKTIVLLTLLIASSSYAGSACEGTYALTLQDESAILALQTNSEAPEQIVGRIAYGANNYGVRSSLCKKFTDKFATLFFFSWGKPYGDDREHLWRYDLNIIIHPAVAATQFSPAVPESKTVTGTYYDADGKSTDSTRYNLTGMSL